MNLELALHWQSEHAGHHDRHFFARVDPAQTDLPAELRAALAATAPGETRACDIPFNGQPARLEATIVAVPPGLTFEDPDSAGYQPVLMALTRGLEPAAQFDKLATLREPYARPHADDAAFYATPRLVDHLDREALAHWREFHAGYLRANMAVLDLMASHDSHLPDAPALREVVGLGMNAAELDANPRLTWRVVRDLNADPALPFADARFDLVLCALSIEYLARPVAVLREARRCLKPGGRAVISFSERWFPPKAVTPWPGMAPSARVAWVTRHLREAGFASLATHSLRGHPRPADDKYARQFHVSDALFAAAGTVGHPAAGTA